MKNFYLNKVNNIILLIIQSAENILIMYITDFDDVSVQFNVRCISQSFGTLGYSELTNLTFIQKITTPPIFGGSNCNLIQMKARYLKNNMCKLIEPKP